MKKNYFIALIALLTFAMNIKAQEINNWETVAAPEENQEETEAYNMVVTLPDGTNFTINTDDVDEVKFTTGRVTVSGISVQWLVEKLYEVLERHYQLRDEVEDQLEEQDKKIAILEEVAKVNSQDSYDLWKRDEEKTRDIKMMMDIITKMQADNVAMMEKIYMLEDKNSKLELINDEQDAKIHEMKMKIESLEVKVKADEENINNLNVTIELLHKALENLQQRVESLESK